MVSSRSSTMGDSEPYPRSAELEVFARTIPVSPWHAMAVGHGFLFQPVWSLDIPTYVRWDGRRYVVEIACTWSATISRSMEGASVAVMDHYLHHFHVALAFGWTVDAAILAAQSGDLLRFSDGELIAYRVAR